MTVRYPWLLFDADDTLFDFRTAELTALAEAFTDAGLGWQPAWAAAYARANSAAWRAFEAGALSSQRLKVQRFADLFAELEIDVDPAAFSPLYLRRLAGQVQLVAGALEMLDCVLPGRRLAIVTNGLAEVQRPRLAASAIASRVEVLVVSEEVGVAKPDPGIFRIALERMGAPPTRDVLVVGDSLRSDIAGGVAAGLDTAWFNPAAVVRESGPAPTYEIRALDEIAALVGG